MPKNILIFSDGTGQSGGIEFDENRSNVYKLYRATRCGPDSVIDPSDQVCFYDAGLGSPADGGRLFGNLPRRLYNTLSQATGLGITANIIDCYAALIRLYSDGDRVFLFGFSRGAYTIRCLAGVMAHCGIPREMPDGSPLPMDVSGSRALAKIAVKDVYQFCSSRPRAKETPYKNFILDTRQLIAARFRKDHGSSSTDAGEEKANVFPYFIGVFDTVATLTRFGLALALLMATAICVGLLGVVAREFATSYLPQTAVNILPSRWKAGCWALSAALIVSLAITVRNYVKFDFSLPGYCFWRKLATIHFATLWQTFYDRTLSDHVVYAKHAISIDENRKDFKRVPWYPTSTRARPVRDPDGNIYFEQVWFSGVHSDIGGGYAENEARLSDITLRWMLAAASIIPNGIKHDSTLLRLHANAAGPQHDEYKARTISVPGLTWHLWRKYVRPIDDPEASLHQSVFERVAQQGVVQFDLIAPYRPENLRHHVNLADCYDDPTAKPNDTCASDDLERRWESQRQKH